MIGLMAHPSITEDPVGNVEPKRLPFQLFFFRRLTKLNKVTVCESRLFSLKFSTCRFIAVRLECRGGILWQSLWTVRATWLTYQWHQQQAKFRSYRDKKASQTQPYLHQSVQNYAFSLPGLKSRDAALQSLCAILDVQRLEISSNQQSTGTKEISVFGARNLSLSCQSLVSSGTSLGVSKMPVTRVHESGADHNEQPVQYSRTTSWSQLCQHRTFWCLKF